MNKKIIEDIWQRKHKEEIQEGRRMTKEEKFHLVLQLHSVGLKLMNTRDKEKKLKFYHQMCEMKKKKLKEFINWQLEKV